MHPKTQELLEKRATQEILVNTSQNLCVLILYEMLNCCFISSYLQVTLGSLEAQVSEASPDQMGLKETEDSQDFLVYLDDKVPYL